MSIDASAASSMLHMGVPGANEIPALMTFPRGETSRTFVLKRSPGADTYSGWQLVILGDKRLSRWTAGPSLRI